jgi:hypothetical protein
VYETRIKKGKEQFASLKSDFTLILSAMDQKKLEYPADDPYGSAGFLRRRDKKFADPVARLERVLYTYKA